VTTSSAKQKGRLLQQKVCALLHTWFNSFGLAPDDFLSRSMGANGVDVILSPHAKRVVGDLAIECKNKETINVAAEFKANADKYPNSIPILFHKKNKYPVLATLNANDLMEILRDAVKTRQI
jgi:hypothetical protein